MKARGTFEVNLQPEDPYTSGECGVTLGRMSIEKRYHGDLLASSQGEMLTVVTPVQGSAGYVALEQVMGTLAGKRGSFTLQHYGLMRSGSQYLLLEVVPDSGTGDLQGISGKMTLQIENGDHLYDLDFEFTN